MPPAKRVLWPTDLRDEDAFDRACEIARNSGAELVLLHVVEDPGEAVYGERSTEGKDRAAWALWKVVQDEKEERLKALATGRTPPLERFRAVCAFGDPAARILEAVETEAIDVVVLAARRRKTLLQGPQLGRVAYQVVRRVSCDVVLVATAVTS